MNIAAIAPQPEMKKLSSNDLKKKVMDYKRDNEYLAKMTSYNETKAQLIRKGIAAERIRK